MNSDGSKAIPELLAIGETMAMMAPMHAERLRDATWFRCDAGGAESNVASHVAASGHRAAWFSHLGDDELGRRVARQISRRGVDVSGVGYDPLHPTGVYVKDPGQGVIYYRRGSAASYLDEPDAEELRFEGVRVVHVSGITAALSDCAAAFLRRVIDRAREGGAMVSFDVNYRHALWSTTAAAAALDPLVRRADLVFVGRDEAETVWGLRDAEQVRGFFSEVPELVVKDGAVGATAFCGGAASFEPALPVDVVEEVGAGDAFAGGYLAAWLEDAPSGERLRRGHLRAAKTLRTTGDSIDED